ncbi:ATP-binding cassette domain-containing protein [Nonomuraea dietziae]|uniref:ATP-binding cassette domain-containing protein n=1 Tax=Nonomuraea dietziae TaxID=65515 RepID=UPI00340913D3
MLRLDRVSKTFRTGSFGGRELHAVREVGFEVAQGEVVSLIGESGSGKTTLGRMILRLAAVSAGAITLDGVDIARQKDYYRSVQGVFQDPFSSYNPIFKADRVLEMIRQRFFPRMGAADWRGRVESSLAAVRLDPGGVLGKYPHQLSGGQLQRLLIARALLLDIRMLVADEIISMLDASTRIDVLNLLGELKGRGLGILFITHDLSLGNYVSEKTVVLRSGRVVEMGRTELVFGNPLHPYTRNLLGSVPRLHRRWSEEEEEEDAPEAEATCFYHGAAGHDATWPGLVEAEPGHFVGCATSGTCASALELVR